MKSLLDFIYMVVVREFLLPLLILFVITVTGLFIMFHVVGIVDLPLLIKSVYEYVS